MNYLGTYIFEAEYQYNNKTFGKIKVNFSKIKTEKERQTIYKRIEKKILNNKNIVVLQMIWKEVEEDVEDIL